MASIYRSAEFLLAGSLLQRARTAALPFLPPPQRALLLGEGPGRLLEALHARYPEAEFSVVEASRAMIEQAQRTCPVPSRVHWHCADVFALEFPEKSFDWITTPFFLDCWTEPLLRRLIASAGRALRPGGFWLVTDFGVPLHGWQRLRAQAMHKVMYTFFHHIIGIPARSWVDPKPYFEDAGFVQQWHQTFSAGLIFSSVWQWPERQSSASALRAQPERMPSGQSGE